MILGNKQKGRGRAKERGGAEGGGEGAKTGGEKKERQNYLSIIRNFQFCFAETNEGTKINYIRWVD